MASSDDVLVLSSDSMSDTDREICEINARRQIRYDVVSFPCEYIRICTIDMRVFSVTLCVTVQRECMVLWQQCRILGQELPVPLLALPEPLVWLGVLNPAPEDSKPFI